MVKTILFARMNIVDRVEDCSAYTTEIGRDIKISIQHRFIAPLEQKLVSCMQVVVSYRSGLLSIH